MKIKIQAKARKRLNWIPIRLHLLVVICMHCSGLLTVHWSGKQASQWSRGISKGGMCSPACPECKTFYKKLGEKIYGGNDA